MPGCITTRVVEGKCRHPPYLGKITAVASVHLRVGVEAQQNPSLLHLVAVRENLRENLP